MHYADVFTSSAETLIPPPPPVPLFSRLLGTPYRTDPPRSTVERQGKVGGCANARRGEWLSKRAEDEGERQGGGHLRELQCIFL